MISSDTQRLLLNESFKIPCWTFHNFSLLYFHLFTYCYESEGDKFITLLDLYLTISRCNYHMKNGTTVKVFPLKQLLTVIFQQIVS